MYLMLLQNKNQLIKLKGVLCNVYTVHYAVRNFLVSCSLDNLKLQLKTNSRFRFSTNL